MNEKEFEEKYPGGLKLDCTCYGDREPQYLSLKCSKCDNYATYARKSKYTADVYLCDKHKRVR